MCRSMSRARRPRSPVAVATNVYVWPAKAAPGWVQSLANKLPPRFQVPAVRAAPYAPYAAIAVITSSSASSLVIRASARHPRRRRPCL